MAQTILNVLIVILIIALVALVVLYFLGNKLQKRQVEQQQLLDAAAQTASILVIDKKKMKITQAGLPKAVTDQTPKYMRWAKVPVVKAKIGPKVMTLIADGRVFDSLPVKTEAKVVISGIYITEIKSVRGGAIPTPPKKKGFFARFKRIRKIRNKRSGSCAASFYIFLLQLSVYCVPCTLSLRAGLDIQADAAIGQMLIINIQGIVHIHQQTVRFFINFNPVGLYAYHHIAQRSGVA